MQVFAKLKNASKGVQSNLKFSKIWGGSEPPLQNFLNFEKTCIYHADYNSLIKNGVTELIFEL